ncbi:helix-turn-helix domain-containing protein [Chitinophaga skermanii]|nr:AraC family transcriptional regulator [Chitinophaga skermanii]
MIYVISIGAFQAFVATLLLWRNEVRDKADALILVLLMCIATHLGIKFYIYSFVSDEHVRMQMNTFIGLCYGPLAYLYVRKKLQPQLIVATKWYLFLPFLLAAIGYSTVVCLLYAYTPVGYKALALYNDVSTWMLIISGLIYPILILKKQPRLQGKQEQQLVLHIGILLLSVGIIACVFQVYGMVSKADYTTNLVCRNICYTLLSIICIDILRYKYKGVAQQTQLEEVDEMKGMTGEEEVLSLPSELPLLPTKKTILNEYSHAAILEKLESHLAQSHLYTDANLSLDKLAEAIQESKYHVSEALNAYAHKSFYQYINEHRVAHAVEMMTRIQQKGLPVNILVIAYECGFKAKSSFNTYFKKIVGDTPSAFLAKQKSTQLAKV